MGLAYLVSNGESGGFRDTYTSEEFGKSLTDYLNNNKKFRGKSPNEIAQLILNPEIRVALKTVSEDLSWYTRGNMVGYKRRLTQNRNSVTIRDCVLRLFYVLNAIGVPKEHEMISMIRSKTNVNDVDYPPTEIYPSRNRYQPLF
ncbi:MAG: hypothetical protein A2639_00520 [Candidatus Staskawiczbacteria bacterium RIFCSPHIGHO2_01_FULL_34_27]|uniref:Uncharacterized protein n=1 Tax=Candidatus Staskawiczbacteria bacterium RIFCSPHIGHO2_01_FULL_34_27 TaxID=1802199 RepID=A0A1G2HJ76_9BACT|nr:hypothetical protein [Candidatus Pacearchaeota archaeon]OGZ62552.1 MAG: hypothetical protein A2639_00520 [Candidatus Staskawiczbacteria bacterium RIFCSPHIGHO2_01_FULL_34_27]